MKREDRGIALFSHIAIFCLVILCLLPLVLLISASLSNESTLMVDGYRFIPSQLSFEAYDYLFNRSQDIFQSLGVSVFVTIVGTLVGVLVTALVGYALSRKETPFRNVIMFVVFFTMLFGGGLIPTYLIYSQIFHLKNTIWALIFPGLLTNGFYIMIARTLFQTTVPGEVIESAQLDGASEYRIFYSIIAPLSAPILATLGLFTSVMYWNDWQNGMIYLTDPNLFSLQNLLNRIMQDVQYLQQMTASQQAQMSGHMPSDTVKMAIAVIGAFPILAAYPFFQKYFIKGIAIGAVKG